MENWNFFVSTGIVFGIFTFIVLFRKVSKIIIKKWLIEHKILKFLNSYLHRITVNEVPCFIFYSEFSFLWFKIKDVHFKASSIEEMNMFFKLCNLNIDAKDYFM